MGNNMGDKKTFGLCGLGNISSRHIKAIEEIGGKIVATYDVDQSRNPTCQSFEELLESDAEWIVVLSPNKLHRKQTLQAARAGKKVITEKPPVLSYGDLWGMWPHEYIYTISQLRYMQSVKDLRMKVKDSDGYIGTLNIVASRDPYYLANWRGNLEWSGGLLYTIGIHYLDLLTWIFGSVKKIDYVRWFNDWKVQGRIELERGTFDFNIEVSEDEPNFKLLEVNDEEIDLAAGFFELHGEAYKDIFNGGGIHPKEMHRAIELIDKLYGYKKD